MTGLLWLLLSYGYVLFYASNLISEGSELLLLIPSLAGLVGGVVLPLLGAVPDGAIILFSGLGSIETAQETLSVGVGALAGSTIMLLTVPLALSVYGGRVNCDINGVPNYMAKPKSTPQPTWKDELNYTGVTLTTAVKAGGRIMMVTTSPYLLIQGPAWALHGPQEEIAKGEHWWSLAGLVICLVGLLWYLHLQLKMSLEHENQDKRMAVLKKQLHLGAVSLSGALAAELKYQEEGDPDALARQAATEYQSVATDEKNYYPSSAVAEYLKKLLAESFYSYDSDHNGVLDRAEVFVFFRDFHENITEQEMEKLFKIVDKDNSDTIDLDEFIGVAYMLIKTQENKSRSKTPESAVLTDESESQALRKSIADAALTTDNEEEEEEIPEEFTSLSPDEQQAAIKRKAFYMLAAGTILVVAFSDPMVDVLNAIATRANLSPFYVSFVLAPLASNASEILASQYYASKKTRKTITVSLTTLEGAASINNTFCLSIFMGLIYFRGLAWQYSAETITIILTQVLVGYLVQRPKMTLGGALFVLCIFPLSIAVVAILEAMGFD